MQQVAESSDIQISTRNITGTELVCVECFHFNVSWKHGLFITRPVPVYQRPLFSICSP